MSIEVKALKPHHYGGRPRRIGDVYQVSGKSQLNLVRALGWSEKVPTPAAKAPEPAKNTKPEFASGGLVPASKAYLVGESPSSFQAPSTTAAADAEPKADTDVPASEPQIPPPADAPAPPPPADPAPADPVPDDGSEKPAVKERAAPKRTYQRRDMAAE